MAATLELAPGHRCAALRARARRATKPRGAGRGQQHLQNTYKPKTAERPGSESGPKLLVFLVGPPGVEPGTNGL
ncbi:hypothetical protein GCM10023089_34190 [Quisquiliibacterium transsilvanicum]